MNVEQPIDIPGKWTTLFEETFDYDWVENTYPQDVAGRSMTMLGEHFSSGAVAASAEILADNVLKIQSLAFSIPADRFQRPRVLSKKLWRDVNVVTPFCLQFGKREPASPRLNLLLRACIACSLLGPAGELKVDLHRSRMTCDDAELYNRIISFMRELSDSSWYRNLLEYERHCAARNYRSAVKYSNELFDKHARILVVRVDLGYLVEHGISIRTSQADLNRFLRNMRNNRIFRGLIGYAWKREVSSKGNVHFHLILFYNGSLVKSHVYIANKVGKYWVDGVTKGRGRFHNCNKHASKFRRRAIGMIHYNDSNRREDLLYVLRYLTKSGQSVLVKVDERTRNFGRGICKPFVFRSGRPRKVVKMLERLDERRKATGDGVVLSA